MWRDKSGVCPKPEGVNSTRCRRRYITFWYVLRARCNITHIGPYSAFFCGNNKSRARGEVLLVLCIPAPVFQRAPRIKMHFALHILVRGDFTTRRGSNEMHFKVLRAIRNQSLLGVALRACSRPVYTASKRVLAMCAHVYTQHTPERAVSWFGPDLNSWCV
jgi:hypothetical protein